MKKILHSTMILTNLPELEIKTRENLDLLLLALKSSQLCMVILGLLRKLHLRRVEWVVVCVKGMVDVAASKEVFLEVRTSDY